MTRPKPKKLPKTLAPWEDPASPDYISPREDRRMRRELFRRVELLFAIADAKGYGPPKSPPSSPEMIGGPSDAQNAKQHPTARVGSGGPVRADDRGPTLRPRRVEKAEPFDRGPNIKSVQITTPRSANVSKIGQSVTTAEPPHLTAVNFLLPVETEAFSK